MAGSLNTVSYTPAPSPSDVKALPTYTMNELRRVAAALRLLADGHVDPAYVAPTRPRDGDIRLADGANWEPGSGQGPYMFYDGDWQFMGPSAPTAFRAPAYSVAPASPADGDIALADGTGWDPGAGAGIYGFYAATWHKLG